MEPEAVVSLDTSQGVHPQVVAQDFGVHLRTIFRWIKYGFLKSKNGRVDSEYKTTSLLDWRRSCWFHEARRKEKLNISNGTMTSWKKKGLIETVTVMGFERVLISSVDDMIKRRNRRTFSLHPTHSLPHLILEITGVEDGTLKCALDNGTVPFDLIDGVRMIPNEEVARIRKAWISSCRSMGAQIILGKSGGVISRLVISERLPTVIVLGQRRIILKGIAKTPEEKQHLKIYLASERKKYLRRVRAGIKQYRKLKKIRMIQKLKKINANKPSKKFLCKRELSVKRLEPIIIPDYKPISVKVRGFESRRLTTCEEAAKATGRSVDYINELFRTGKTIRGEVVDDKLFIYILSLETLIVKLKEKKII